MARNVATTRTSASRRVSTFNAPYSLYFTFASSSYAALDSNVIFDSTQPFAFSLWVDLGVYYSRNVTTAAGLISFKTDQGVPFVVYYNGGNAVRFTLGANSLFLTTTIPLTGNPNLRNLLNRGWHHIVMTFDGVSRTSASSYRIYVDGTSYTPSGSATITATSHLNTLGILGASNPGNGYYTRLRVWSGGSAMTSAQVTELFYDDTLPSGPTLIREYLFTEGSGASLADTSGGGFNGTVNTTSNWNTNVPRKTRTVASAVRTTSP